MIASVPLRLAAFFGAVGGVAYAVLMTVWLLAAEVAGVPGPGFVSAYIAFYLLVGAASTCYVLRASR